MDIVQSSLACVRLSEIAPPTWRGARSFAVPQTWTHQISNASGIVCCATFNAGNFTTQQCCLLRSIHLHFAQRRGQPSIAINVHRVTMMITHAGRRQYKTKLVVACISTLACLCLLDVPTDALSSSRDMYTSPATTILFELFPSNRHCLICDF